jgi:hypothetical protein
MARYMVSFGLIHLDIMAIKQFFLNNLCQCYIVMFILLIFFFSFKSKRYRDKLRTEIKGLEGLIPIDRSSLHRKLDSQTVFRLIISFFRIKMFFKGNY